MHYFDVSKTFFTLWGYQMSYIEFFGTLFNLACVWLVAKKNIWTWGVGVIGSLLFLSLFYQLRLYADVFEQVFFIITGLIGWLMWSRSPVHATPKEEEDEEGWLGVETMIRSSTNLYLTVTCFVIAIGTVVGMYIIGHLNDWLPNQFPDEASFLFLDVTTTVWSFVATVMMMQRRMECWTLWIMVDLTGIGLYFAKDVPFIAALYVVFLFIAVKGQIDWVNTRERQEIERKRSYARG
jgi:nicotinamide mononucleotide transporter